MEVFLAQVVNGLSLGSIYVLLVTGFNLLLLVALVIHFSYPQVVVFSMYISWVVLRFTNDNLVLGILAGMLSAIALNMAFAPMFQKVMNKRGQVDINATMVVSLAIGMIITDLLAREFNNGFPIAFPESLKGDEALFSLGLIHVSQGQVITLAVGIVMVSLFFWLLYRTKYGRAFRAIAEDPANARLVGIPILKTGILSYALTGLLGGMTAVLLAVLLGAASPVLGELVAHKVLAVSIIAGLGNLVGGLIVGVALGILEAIIQGYVSGSWSNAIAFVILLVIMLVRPRGVFGMKL